MTSSQQERDADWLSGLEKQDPTICCLQETQLTGKNNCRQSRGMENNVSREEKPKTSHHSCAGIWYNVREEDLAELAPCSPSTHRVHSKALHCSGMTGVVYNPSTGETGELEVQGRPQLHTEFKGILDAHDHVFKYKQMKTDFNPKLVRRDKENVMHSNKGNNSSRL